MTHSNQINDQNGLYYLTFQIVDWVDIFTRLTNKRIITGSFDYCRKKKGLNLYAYVIMTNHLHLIAQARVGHRLSDIVRDFKKYTANQLLEETRKPEESRRD